MRAVAIDEATGDWRFLEPGEVGTIVLRGPNVFAGYLVRSFGSFYNHFVRRARSDPDWAWPLVRMEASHSVMLAALAPACTTPRACCGSSGSRPTTRPRSPAGRCLLRSRRSAATLFDPVAVQSRRSSPKLLGINVSVDRIRRSRKEYDVPDDKVPAKIEQAAAKTVEPHLHEARERLAKASHTEDG